MDMKLRQMIGTFILCMGLLVACIAAPASTPTLTIQSATSAAAEPISLNVGALPFLSNSILQIAQDEGYFAEEGLDVKLIVQQSSNEFIPLLLKGELDVATPALTAGFFNAVANGGTIKLVLPLTNFTVQDCASIGVIARRSDIDAGTFAMLSQWQGAKVTVPPAGAQALPGYIIDTALRQDGLTLQDVQIVPIDLPVQAEALASGQTDLIYAVEPWITRMTTNPALALLTSVESFVPNMTASTIVFGGKPLADPTIGERFSVAYLKAVRQYGQGKTQRNVQLVAAYTKLEPALIEKLCWSSAPHDGSMNVELIMAYQTWLREQGLLDKTVAPDKFVDMHFAEFANQVLGKSNP